MERKKIKILSNKNKDQQPDATPKPRPDGKEKKASTQKKLSASEKIKQAKLARKSKKTDDGDSLKSEAPKKKKRRRQNSDGILKKIAPLLFITVLGYCAYQLIFWDTSDSPDDPITKETPDKEKVNTENLLYGLDKTMYTTEERVVQENQTLQEFLNEWRYPREVSGKLQTAVAPYMRPAVLKEFQLYTLFFDNEGSEQPAYIVYEPDNYSYITFCLIPEKIGAIQTKRKVKNTPKTFTGTIQTNIADLHSRKKLNYQLLPQLESALAWTVDFYHLKPGAKYKMVFDEIFADGEAVGSKLQALEFKTDKETIRAFFFDDGVNSGFFDERSRPMKRAFLKSPVKYARISSKFNLTRKHPVLGEVKPHLGTDYAAPEGTPIRAISDGVITIATFKKNNGNYVKMKHDKTYESQYLHMSKIMDGIKPGVRVKQGQTIGFVGSTGLATGPHVCFRFWKRGKQIDFVNERLPDSRPIPSNQTVEFIAHRDALMRKLGAIE